MWAIAKNWFSWLSYIALATKIFYQNCSIFVEGKYNQYIPVLKLAMIWCSAKEPALNLHKTGWTWVNFIKVKVECVLYFDQQMLFTGPNHLFQHYNYVNIGKKIKE